ncbi:unnamed protein product [Bemisia tabaci]|uniref:PPIase FKBP-type domain-containing protein n=1 Tax=Bemisia tabaci TaxID=7038 RepID=A0A9P0ACT9_BEMTA|nr:unnamed protein product [Bemisia tabaci]
MFSEDDIDFTPSPNTNLASLFDSSRLSLNNGNQSLTYKAPKQPRSLGKHETPTDSDSSLDSRRSKVESLDSKSAENSKAAKTLDLLIVKTVQAFKMENGNYNNVGRLRAALCGSFVNRCFEFIIYRDKTTHVCRASINQNFKFIVQINNYAAFYNKANQLWSVLFESPQDASEFSTQIALVKWCCLANAGKGSELLIQNLIVGSSDQLKAEDGSIVDIYYVAKTVTPSFKIDREVANNHNDGKPISVTVGPGWEKGLHGVTVNSKRAIIIPYQLLGSWKPLVADECSLMLQITVIKITIAQSPPDTRQTMDLPKIGGPQDSIDDFADDKTVPRVCRPSSRNSRLSYPLPGLHDKVPHSNDSDSESEEDNPVISKLVPGTKQKSKFNNSQMKKRKDHCPDPMNFKDESSSLTQFQHIDPLTKSSSFSADSHLSVYLSEMRIQNSEVRIGLGRVSDKVDQVLNKLEPKSIVDLNSLNEKIGKLTEINVEVKDRVFSDFSTIADQYKEIISLLKNKVDEPTVGDRSRSSCSGEGVDRKNQFESRIADLETENSELKVMLAQSVRENNDLKMHVTTLEQLNSQFQDDLEKASLKGTENHEETSKAEIKEGIKQKMNTIYHALKAEFRPDRHYLGQEIHSQLYNIIKRVTLEYLQELKGDNVRSLRDNTIDEMEKKYKSSESKPDSPVPQANPVTLNDGETITNDHRTKSDADNSLSEG